MCDSRSVSQNATTRTHHRYSCSQLLAQQTRAGQRTRFKAFVVIGDSDGHLGLGVKCSKEVATAIRGAIILAKLSIIPVRRGYCM